LAWLDGPNYNTTNPDYTTPNTGSAIYSRDLTGVDVSSIDVQCRIENPENPGIYFDEGLSPRILLIPGIVNHNIIICMYINNIPQR